MRFGAAGNYVKSIRFNGVDVVSAPLRFDGAISGTFEVTLRSSTARINGIVVDGQSRPVSGIQVVAVPSQRARTDLYKFAFKGADGRFSFPFHAGRRLPARSLSVPPGPRVPARSRGSGSDLPYLAREGRATAPSARPGYA